MSAEHKKKSLDGVSWNFAPPDIHTSDESQKPNVLREDIDRDSVNWYDNHFPVQDRRRNSQYLVIDHAARHEMSELNDADWLILRALFPNGPTEIS